MVIRLPPSALHASSRSEECVRKSAGIPIPWRALFWHWHILKALQADVGAAPTATYVLTAAHQPGHPIPFGRPPYAYLTAPLIPTPQPPNY